MSWQQWWSERSAVGKGVLVVLGGVLLVNIAIALVNLVSGSTPGGPTSSAYATGSDGYAAWADLLARNGHRVTKLSGSLGDAHLTPGATLVVADPGTLEPADAEAAQALLRRGGRVIEAGGSAVTLLPMGDVETAWNPVGPDRSVALQPAPETRGVHQVVSAGAGSFAQPTGVELLLGTSARAVLAVAAWGPHLAGARPRVVAVADSSVFDNAHLARADNAAFAVQVVGPARDVYFAEGVHGYGRSTGLGALPWRWRWTLAGLLAAVLAGMWAVGARLGPTERSGRDLAPPRGRFVDAMAVSLDGTGSPAAAAMPFQEAVRRDVRRRTGISAAAPDADLVAAAPAAGLEAATVARALRPPSDERELVDAAAAAAELRRQNP